MPVNRSREVKPIYRGHKHDAAHSIDFYAYESRLRSWNAGLKMAVGMAALCLCIAADKLSVSVFVIFTMACITVMAVFKAAYDSSRLSFYGDRGDCRRYFAQALR